ncbi:helix-turn-helix domain-containing protein [Paenibacillus macquariensis]|uniref:helix-turn-helix domain-containing protein n=1 Tax=Paenibacillus macquariensis TaxID=948756 RepID=UPI00398AC920
MRREFKKHKGSAPIEYLTQLRIEKAKLLIKDTSDLKFKDLSAMVGYNNQYYFSKVFKLITGLTPTEFKVSSSINH